MNKKWFDNLNIYFKSSLLSTILLIVISLLLIPLYFFKLKEIPLGLMLGSGLGIIVYFLTGIFEEKKKDTYHWAIIIMVTRLLIFSVLLILIALCYYKWDIKLFNLFSFVGGYTLTLIMLVIFYIRKDKNGQL